MRHAKFAFALVLVFAASAALGYFTQLGTPADAPEMPHSQAIWKSSATTPAELVDEAELVARVQVVDRDDTFFVTPSPFQSPKAAADLEARGYQVPRLPFTPAVIEVLEVYSGGAAAGDRIKVMQTGGLVDGQRAEIVDDPLYEVGSEHVLFLRRVEGSDAFVTINPAGRYEVLGSQVEAQSSFFEAGPTAAPTDLADLEAEIRAAVEAQQGVIKG